MKYFPTYIALFFLCFNLSGQEVTYPYKFTQPTKDTIYLDELDKPIDKRKFNYKLDSNLFAALRYNSDTLKVYRLRFSHFFGKLPDTIKQQLFTTLKSRNKIETDQIMVIHYSDTLKSISEFAPKHTIKFTADSSKHWHEISHKEFLKVHKKCIRRYNRRKQSNVYHFYSHNNGHPTEIKKLKWYKDNYKLIARIFKDKYRRFNQIVLHPDGRYFAYNYNDENNEIYSDLSKGKNWDKHQQVFIKRLNSLNSL